MSEISAPLNPLDNRAEFEAEVISTDDPQKLMRAQVRVYGLMDGVPVSKLPWATYRLPVGARVNEGDFRPAHVGDIVWVDFPYTTHGRPDTRRPRITGSVHFCPSGIPNLPPEAWAGPESLQHKRTANEPVPVARSYHESRVFTQHGITVEWERPGVYRITHRKSGTSFELCENGDSVLHTEGNAHFSSTEKTESEVGNTLVINVLKGDTTIHTKDGNTTLKSSGDMTLDAGGKVLIKAGGAITNEAGGAITNQAGGTFTVKAPNFVENLG